MRGPGQAQRLSAPPCRAQASAWVMAAGRRRNPDLSQHLFGEVRRGCKALALRQLHQELALALGHSETLRAVRQVERALRAQKAGGPELDFLRGQMGLQSIVHMVPIRVAFGAGFTGFTPGPLPDSPATHYAPG